MKRFLSSALMLVMLFTMTACDGDKSQKSAKPSEEVSVSESNREKMDPNQQIIGTWTFTFDFGRNENDENEHQLRNLESGEYDNVANKEELSAEYNNYKEYPEGIYVATCSAEFKEDGTYIRTYDTEELKNAYKNILTENRRRYYEAEGTPYVPWDEDALQDKVAITTGSLIENNVYRYQIIDSILYISQTEQGKITIDGDKMTVTPTETSYLRDPIVYTRVS
ncbi:MAG: hypothetical protein IJD11_00305 [Oscillospiraceae bacterium]|nr:hypothetical protein [Oscillospiraceae bacterium]